MAFPIDAPDGIGFCLACAIYGHWQQCSPGRSPSRPAIVLFDGRIHRQTGVFLSAATFYITDRQMRRHSDGQAVGPLWVKEVPGWFLAMSQCALGGIEP